MQSFVIKINSVILLFLVSAVLGVAVSYSKIYLFHVVLVALVVALCCRTYLAGIKLNRYPTKMHYVFYFMLGWYSLTVIWSENVHYTVEYIFYIVCGLSVILAVIYYVSDLERQEKLLNVLGKVFILEIIICLLESAGILRMPVSPYSSYLTLFGREMTISHLSAEVAEIVTRSSTGFQWNPNNLATTMNIIFPFFLFHKNKILKFAGVLSILTIIICAGSRGNFIAFFAMLLLYFFIYANKIIKISFLLMATLIIIVWESGVVLHQFDDSKLFRLIHVHQSVGRYANIIVQSEKEIKEDSVNIRKVLIGNGLSALVETNYMGVGGGASKAIYESNIKATSGIVNVHNFGVEILVEGGVLFFIVFVSWYLVTLYKLYRIGKNASDSNLRYYANSCFLSLFGFIFGSISPSSVIYLFPMWLLYGFSIATVNNYWRLTHENTNTVRS